MNPTFSGMLAFAPYQHTVMPDREEYVYSFSVPSTETLSYSSSYVPSQPPVRDSYEPYTVQSNFTLHSNTNYPMDSQLIRPKYQKYNTQLYSPIYSPRSTSAPSYFQHIPVLSSTSDGASIHSGMSSGTGSPLLSVEAASEWDPQSNLTPGIPNHPDFHQSVLFANNFNYEAMALPEKPGCVDPSLIQPPPTTPPMKSEPSTTRSFLHLFPHPPSPAASSTSSKSQSATGVLRTNPTRNTSPYLGSQTWNPYPTSPPRRQSISSTHSHHSRQSQSSLESEENKGTCPIASCGRHIKDLKAHLLTHKNERPEKCPISSCEYHIKGFARKYDKNRHTLTHYKGTMVCGFCPGSGSPAEKGFNRADVFKRHLTSVHSVEQTAPNSRRRSFGNSMNGKRSCGQAGASGMCSTCGIMFPNVQDFYEHLDDCVLRVVQAGDPCEAINERILTAISDDKAVKETMERHSLGGSLDFTVPTSFDEEEEVSDEEKNTNDGLTLKTSSRPSINGSAPKNIHQGMTYSKGGVTIHGNGKGNKRRKNYPPSWNSAPDKMRMRKRVLCVFDGPRRLWKDDMMLGTDNQVREPLSGGDGRNWVTSLDVQTLRRAEGILETTEEEKGVWGGFTEQGYSLALTV